MRLVFVFFCLWLNLASAFSIEGAHFKLSAAINHPNVVQARQNNVVTRYITRYVTRTAFTTVTAAPRTVFRTAFATLTSFITSTQTAYTTTSTIVKRTAIPEAHLEKRQRAGRTVTVYRTSTTTRTSTRTIANRSTATLTTTRYNTVRATTRVTQTVTRTAYTTSVAPKPSSSVPPPTPTGGGGRPFANPDLDNPASFQNNILKQHNDFRALFGSPPLVWDTDLATFASQWTSGCKYYHSIEAYPNPPWVAENIAAAWSSRVSDLSGFTSSLPVQLWGVDEFKLYSYNPRTSTNDHATGHFQNMVWKSYQSLGCAVSYCPNGLKDDQGGQITTSPALYWSCDFGINDYSQVVSWDVDYNIPRNISVVY